MLVKDNRQKIDAWFDAKTRGLMPRAKARLKQVWGNMQKVYSSRDRLEKIVNDIIFDFESFSAFCSASAFMRLISS